jgi:hypothetical protein
VEQGDPNDQRSNLSKFPTRRLCFEFMTLPNASDQGDEIDVFEVVKAEGRSRRSKPPPRTAVIATSRASLFFESIKSRIEQRASQIFLKK